MKTTPERGDPWAALAKELFDHFCVQELLSSEPSSKPQQRKRIVAFVGAGASKEAGLPLGQELKHYLFDKLTKGSDAVLTPDGANQECIKYAPRRSKADGTVVITPDYNIQDMPVEATRDAPMSSDIHEKHVTVKALGVGDTLEYSVRYRTTKPQVPGQFWFEYTFTKDVIAKDEELEIDVPRDKYVKIASPDYPPKINDAGGLRIYVWKTANLERKANDTQIIVPQPHEAPKPSVQMTTFHTWEDVGRWYGELQRSQVVVTPQIQAKAAELTKGISSDEDKIRAIYDFVSTKYHYVSLSFGIGRYQPPPAEDTLENEYGDSDKIAMRL